MKASIGFSLLQAWGLVQLGLIALACVPAYRWSRRNGTESRWLMWPWVPAVTLWIGLVNARIGPQSLGNVVEPIIVIAAGIVLAYAKVLVVDRRFRRPKASTWGLIGLLMAGAAVLRVLMPVVPE